MLGFLTQADPARLPPLAPVGIPTSSSQAVELIRLVQERVRHAQECASQIREQMAMEEQELRQRQAQLEASELECRRRRTQRNLATMRAIVKLHVLFRRKADGACGHVSNYSGDGAV